MTKATYDSIAPDFDTSRIIKGCWQLAGDHGDVDRALAVTHMEHFFDAGIRNFDCADIYTGVEEMIGAFIKTLRHNRGSAVADTFKVHTKLVPNLDKLETTTHTDIEHIIDTSLKRLNLDRLDLVQFYWWDLSLGNPVEILSHLSTLQKKGKINKLGVTNWNEKQIQPFIDAGMDIVSAQIQYSIFDNRPKHSNFTKWCEDNSVKMLCYGSLAGGFLTEKWLGVTDDPGFMFENRSLIKYRLIIDEFGSWENFQSLLTAMHTIAQKHGVTISAVASRYVLEQKQVAAAIVGARYSHHLDKTMQVFNLQLDNDDRAILDGFVQNSKGPNGDVYALEQDRTGRHGSIMKYSLNE